MVSQVERHLPALHELCRRYNVERLELFGSAATGEFDPARSDVDLLVRFGPCGEMGGLRQYMGFLFDCEAVLGRSVDLVEEEAIGNAVFRQAIQQSRTVVYAP